MTYIGFTDFFSFLGPDHNVGLLNNWATERRVTPNCLRLYSSSSVLTSFTMFIIHILFSNSDLTNNPLSCSCGTGRALQDLAPDVDLYGHCTNHSSNVQIQLTTFRKSSLHQCGKVLLLYIYMLYAVSSLIHPLL